MPGIRKQDVNTVIGESRKPIEASGSQPGQDCAVPRPQEAYPELVIGRKRAGMSHEDPRARLLPPATAHPPPNLCGGQHVQGRRPGHHGRCDRLPDGERGRASVAGHQASVPPAGRGRHIHAEPVDIASSLSTARNLYPHPSRFPAILPASRSDLSAIRAAITARIALKSSTGRSAGGGVADRSAGKSNDTGRAAVRVPRPARSLCSRREAPVGQTGIPGCGRLLART